MKKNIFALIFLFSIFFSLNVFAQDAVPAAKKGFILGFITEGSIPLDYISETDLAINNASYLRLGYMFPTVTSTGVSFSIDLGYNMTVTSSSLETLARSEDISNSGFYIHSLLVGIQPALHIKNFTIGFGGGVKIPITATKYNSTVNIDNESGSFDFSSSGFTELSMVPYIKLSFDYLFFFDTRTAFLLGINLGYDFNLEEDNNRVLHASPEGFFIGFNAGLRIGPRL